MRASAPPSTPQGRDHRCPSTRLTAPPHASVRVRRRRWPRDAARGPRAARHRRRPSARQLHDQPLRRRSRRARPDPARRRHRPGRDPDVPGAPADSTPTATASVSDEETEAGRGGRVRRRSRRSLDLRVDGQRGTLEPGRGRADLPAGRRRAVDDAPRCAGSRAPRRARSTPARDRASPTVVRRAARLARDRRRRLGRDARLRMTPRAPATERRPTA